MLVPCKFRGDHMTNRSRPHGPNQCPPAPGERGDHRRNKRLAARRRAKQSEVMDVRGVAVAGMCGGQAKTHRAGKKASKVAKAAGKA